MKMEFLRMKTEDATSNDEMTNTVNKLAAHAIKLGGLGVGTLYFQWLAFVAAMSVFSLSPLISSAFAICYLLNMVPLLFLLQILVGFGSHKLEDEHSDRTFSALHLFQSTIAAVCLRQGTDWNVGCFHNSCTARFLPTPISGLAGITRCNHSDNSSGS